MISVSKLVASGAVLCTGRLFVNYEVIAFDTQNTGLAYRQKASRVSYCTYIMYNDVIVDDMILVTNPERNSSVFVQGRKEEPENDCEQRQEALHRGILLLRLRRPGFGLPRWIQLSSCRV